MRLVNDTFAGRVAGSELSRVVWLCLTPTFFSRHSAPLDEVRFQLTTATRIDLPYGIETLTQARLKIIIAAVRVAVKAGVADVPCFSSEFGFSCCLCFTLVLVIGVLCTGLFLTIGTEAFSYPGAPGCKNRGVRSNLAFSIHRVLASDPTSQLHQLVCSKRRSGSKCEFF